MEGEPIVESREGEIIGHTNYDSKTSDSKSQGENNLEIQVDEVDSNSVNNHLHLNQDSDNNT